MSEITPLRRTVWDGSKLKRVGGVWGELLAEFLDTFVVICFGGGVVALASRHFRGLAADHVGLA